MKYLVQEHSIEFSGYVRGNKMVKIYYDSETKELIDSEVITDIKITRDDTERYDLPSFNESKDYTIEEEV